jgi:intracellular sulfur oxidation DsrE/DsrF family protein
VNVVAAPSIRRASLLLAGFLWAGLVGVSVVSAPLATGSRASAEEGVLPDKPFADHRLAYNLLKFYGPDRIAIEVVTFGPGIDLLRADNSNRQFVDSLVAQGVRFDVCMNTVETIERETGRRPQLNPNAVPVEAGVAQILALSESGYTLVRP